jgi:predicted ATPase
VLADGTKAVSLPADLLSISSGDRYSPLNLTSQKRKEKTLDAQLAQVEGLASRQPVLIVWEDAHWSDPTTRELLDLLIDRVPTLRVLVIITLRREFAPPWIGRPHVTTLNLSQLPKRQRAEMIDHLTGGKTRKSPTRSSTAPTACHCLSRNSPSPLLRADWWQKLETAMRQRALRVRIA